jgi:murein DD-endopeptidase MepM/ murein hydrolase activator NlpD
LKKLGLDKVQQSSYQTLATSLIWPIKASANLFDVGYHFIGAYVDQNAAAGQVKDFNCGNNTYDGHRGTDIAAWPYGFLKMENNLVQVVAAAPGTIIQKADGNFDRNCVSNSLTANSIIIQHADGSQALYWHMKKNAVTSKTVGQTVEAGEYLGIVGSSGSSSGPHLHFEIWSGNTNATYKDPFSGACNLLNANSWWASQKPAIDPAVMRVSVATTDLVMPGCPTTETPNESNSFTVPFQGASLPAGYAKFYIFMRDMPANAAIDLKILNPNGTTFNSWTHTVPSFSKISYWGWSKTLPVTPGLYAFQASYNGNICSWPFEIRTVATPPTFTFIGNGNWETASNWINNSMPPSNNLANGTQILISPIATGECILNGMQTIGAGSHFKVVQGKKVKLRSNLHIQ